jgi:hypothetical protein
MPTETETIEALKNRLTRRLSEIDNERAELVEAIRVLAETPRLLAGVKAPARQESVGQKTVGRTLSNRNVTQLVRDYIDSFEREKALDVGGIVKWLQEQGVKGKQRSLYSAVHVILKKETRPTTGDQARLAYQKGVGFFKPKQEATDSGARPVMIR